MTVMFSGALVTASFGVPALSDIDRALARAPRFGGHTTLPWSVLDHTRFCWFLSEGMDDEVRLAVLLHDAHEAVTGDIPSDVKSESMREVQNQIDARIYRTYHPSPQVALSPQVQRYVKAIDRRALAAEAHELLPRANSRKEWFGLPTNGDLDVLRNAMRPSSRFGFSITTLVPEVFFRIRQEWA